MIDLTTEYLGLKLPHPFVPGASPLADDLATVRRLEDAGAAAITLRSLFAEQVAREELGAFIHMDRHGESFAEASAFFPSPDKFVFGPEEYLNHLRRVKEAVSVPVIASLNGTTPGVWLEYPALMEQIGADALELNLYQLALDGGLGAADVERLALEVVSEVKKSVRIPVAVKLSPFYSSLVHFALALERVRADGLVLFNRFYQPDIDPEGLQVAHRLELSTSAELPLRLRWLAALSGRVGCTLAVSGGVHTALDAIKAVMAGAHAVQVVSALLQRGPSYLQVLRQETEAWMEKNEWASLRSMRGNMNLQRCPDPEVYERANYMLMLQGWRGRTEALH
jgi:dihydroorotate dehydrogenase (fumarate)